MLLRDWVPKEFFNEYRDCAAYKHLDVEVVEQYGVQYIDGQFVDSSKPWIGKEKNVQNWCVLANGRAIGWNENPGRGWSFPMIMVKGNK